MGGLVVARQRPGTAKGIVFLLLEDEFGTINLIVPPPVYERHRLVVRSEPLLLVRGRLEKLPAAGGALNVLVRAIAPLAAPAAAADVVALSERRRPDAASADGSAERVATAVAAGGGPGDEPPGDAALADFRGVAPAVQSFAAGRRRRATRRRHGFRGCRRTGGRASRAARSTAEMPVLAARKGKVPARWPSSPSCSSGRRGAGAARPGVPRRLAGRSRAPPGGQPTWQRHRDRGLRARPARAGTADPARGVRSDKNRDSIPEADVTQLTSLEQHGQQLFGTNCRQCHTLKASGAAGVVGPNLDELKPPKALVLDAIKKGRAHGNGNMAAELVEGEDAEAVAQYVAVAVGSDQQQ